MLEINRRKLKMKQNNDFNFDQWFLDMSNFCDPWDFPYKEKSSVRLGFNTCKNEVLKILKKERWCGYPKDPRIIREIENL